MATLLDIYTINKDGCRSIVVKHFSVTVDDNELRSYLENVCSTELESLYIPTAGCDVAIAVFKELVYDKRVERWQKRAFSNDIAGSYPTLELLGTPAGLIVHDIPCELTDFSVLQYLDHLLVSKDYVSPGTELVHAGTERFVSVTVSSEQVLASILDRCNEFVEGHRLTVSPFYPAVHRHLLDTLHNRIASTGTMISGMSSDYNTVDPVIQQMLASSEERSNQAIATVRPVVREQIDIPPGPSLLGIEHDPKAIQPDFVEEITLPEFKIALLKASDFKTMNESPTIKITFIREDMMKLETPFMEELRKVKLKLYELLDKIISKMRRFSEQEYQFLSRSQCMESIRSRSETDHLNVVYETHDRRLEIRCHAFTDSDCEAGIQLLDVVINTIEIDITTEQLNQLHDREWVWLMSTLDKDSTTVYVGESERRIYIKSLSVSKATAAKRKVTKFLKECEDVSNRRASVTLESSKARCFKACLEHKLRQEVMKKNGSLDVIELQTSPLLLKLSVHGNEAAVGEMRKVLNLIWHESVDFRSISTSGDDFRFLMKGLDGDSGKEFICKFERKHSCFIDMVKDENLSDPRAKIEVEEEVKLPDDESLDTSDELEGLDEDTEVDTLGALGGATSHQSRSHSMEDTRGTKREHRYSEYQTKMSEEEAVAMAIQQSLQSELDARPVAVIQPVEVYPDSDEESEVTHVFDNNFTVYDQPFNSLDDVCTGSANNGSIPKSTTPIKHGPSDSGVKVLRINKTKVRLIQGAIATHKADALVNIVHASRGIREGRISQSFLKLGGEQLVEMYESTISPDSSIVVTPSAGQLNCSAVFHVQIRKSQDCKQVIRRAVTDILGGCLTWGYRGVALPAIGAGQMFGFPKKIVAETLLSELSRQLQSRKYRIQKVDIVVHGEEENDIFGVVFDNYQHPPQIQPHPVPGLRHRAAGSFSDPNLMEEYPAMKISEKFNKHPQCGLKMDSSNHPQNRPSARGRSDQYSSEGASLSKGSNDVRRKDKASKPRGNEVTRNTFRSSKQTRSVKIPVFKVRVFAQDRVTCIQARDELSSRMKKTFLCMQDVEKKKDLSASSKQQLQKILQTYAVKSIENDATYTLKGHKRNVEKAFDEIKKVLIADKDRKDLLRSEKQLGRRETREFIEIMVNDEPEVPSYWKHYKKGETLKSLILNAKHFFTKTKYERIELSKDSREFASIVRMINGTFNSKGLGSGKDAFGLGAFKYQRLYILKVERIENLRLYEEFARKRQVLFRQLKDANTTRFPKLENLPNSKGDVRSSKHCHPHLDKDLHPEVNEYLLFHGTRDSNVEAICNDGLDSRLADNNAMLGLGVYAAESATKADQYADDKNDRSAGVGNRKKMFLIRMLLGNIFLCSDSDPDKFRRPPCTKCYKDACKKISHEGGTFGRFFDSVVSDGKSFREFVVYEGSRCYPEYLITYERR